MNSLLYYIFILQENKLYNLKNKIQKLSSTSKQFSWTAIQKLPPFKIVQHYYLGSGAHSKLEIPYVDRYYNSGTQVCSTLQTTYSVYDRRALVCGLFHKYDLKELQRQHPSHLDENRKQLELKIGNLSVKLSNLFLCANCISKICTLHDNGFPMQLNATCEHSEHLESGKKAKTRKSHCLLEMQWHYSLNK